MSAVLLRRLLSNSFEEVWPLIQPPLQEAIKQELMLAVQEELTPPVRRKVCDVVAELARNMIGKIIKHAQYKTLGHTFVHNLFNPLSKIVRTKKYKNEEIQVLTYSLIQ